MSCKNSKIWVDSNGVVWEKDEKGNWVESKYTAGCDLPNESGSNEQYERTIQRNKNKAVKK